MNKVKAIKTERLILSPLDTSYFVSTKSYTTDPENTRFMVHMPKSDDQEVMEFLRYCEDEWAKKDPSFYEFAVLYESVHIGSVSLYFTDDHKGAELGYIIDRAFHGNGFATECAHRLIELSREIGVKRITAHCDSENVASKRVLEKIGMYLISVSSGRRNRISSEIRSENYYELLL